MKKIFTIAAILFLYSVKPQAQFTYLDEVCSAAIPLQVSSNSHRMIHWPEAYSAEVY